MPLPEPDAGVPAEEPEGDPGEEPGTVALPQVDVPTPEEAEAALSGIDDVELPDDELFDQMIEEEIIELEEEGPPATDLPGIIVGRTNLPVVNEGDALFHIARVPPKVDGEARVETLTEQLDGDPLFDEDEII